MRQHNALFSSLREEHVSGDTERFVLHVGRCTFGNARKASVVGELGAPARQAGTKGHIHSRNLAVVQRQHVISGGLRIEQQLELAEFVRVLVGKVDGFAEVLGDVIELPLVAADYIDLGSVERVFPRQRSAGSCRPPSIVIDAAIAEHLEILRPASGRRFGIVEGVGHPYALDGFLRHAVDDRRLLQAGYIQKGRHDVDRVMPLRPDATRRP